MVEFELIDDRPAEPFEVTINIANGVIKLPEDFRKRYLQGRTKKIAFLYNDDGVFIYIKSDTEKYPVSKSHSVPKDGTIVNKGLAKNILNHFSAPLPTLKDYIYTFKFIPYYEKQIFACFSEVVITEESLSRLTNELPSARLSPILDRYNVPALEALLGTTISVCPNYFGRGNGTFYGGVILTHNGLEHVKTLYLETENDSGWVLNIIRPRSPRWETESASFYASFTPPAGEGGTRYDLVTKESFYPVYPIMGMSSNLQQFFRRYKNFSPLIEKLLQERITVSTRVDPMMHFDLVREDDNIYISFLTLDKWYRCKNDARDFYTSRLRTKLRLSRFLAKMFPEAKSQDIELIGNTVKGIELVGLDSITEVSGEDIKRVYLDSNYGFNEGTLGNSCMRYENVQHKLDFYVKNSNVRCAVLEYGGKILARALVWTLMDGTEMMDRPYYTKDSYASLFVEYARTKGYKYIYDYRIPKNGKSRESIPIHTTGPDTWSGDYTEKFDVKLNWLPIGVRDTEWSRHQSISDSYYPYMDNFTWINYQTKVLSNLSKITPPVPNLSDIPDIDSFNENDSEYYIFCQYNGAFYPRFDSAGDRMVVRCPYDDDIRWAHIDNTTYCSLTDCHSTYAVRDQVHGSYLPRSIAYTAYFQLGSREVNWFLEEYIVFDEQLKKEVSAEQLAFICNRLDIDVDLNSTINLHVDLYKVLLIEFSNKDRISVEEEEEEAVTITSNTNTNE